MDSLPDSLRDDPQVTHYLDTLCAWLALMPPAERGEIRQEVRQHLVSLAVAEQQNSVSHDEAITAAIHRLGPADALGRKMQTAYTAKAMRQIARLTPPDFQKRAQRFMLWVFACVGINLCIVAAVIWCHPSLATWPVFLTLGAVTGIGLGSGLGVFYAGLPERKPVFSATPTAAQEVAALLPPLLKPASFALRWTRQQTLEVVKLMKVQDARPSSRVYVPNFMVLRAYLFGIMLPLAFMLWVSPPSIKRLGFSALPFKVIIASALMFTTQEVSAVIVSRLLYHRSHRKSPE